MYCSSISGGGMSVTKQNQDLESSLLIVSFTFSVSVLEVAIASGDKTFRLKLLLRYNVLLNLSLIVRLLDERQKE